MVFVLRKETEYQSIRTEVIGVYSTEKLAKKAAEKIALQDVDAKTFKPHSDVKNWSKGNLSYTWDDVYFRFFIDDYEIDVTE